MAEGVLGEIVARKRIDVESRFRSLSLDDVRARAGRTQRSLGAVLAKPGARFILEMKRASPSAGQLRAQAEPAAIARGYRGTADAMSVLTDTPFFGGSHADLAAVRRVFEGPILAKDFFIDLRQVAEARAHGADAILVMLSVLDDRAARAMIEEANRFGMDALVEVHDEEEMRRAAAVGATLIGINNRDLRTLEVDLRVTERLAGLAPTGAVIVSESGIGSRRDVERLSRHADAFLIGSSLMRAADPALAARSLVFGRVKMCGITNGEDLRLALGAGAYFAGLVIVPGTPRAVSIGAAERIALEAPEGARLVGVFRNAPRNQVEDAARVLRLDAVQLHGKEDEDYIAALRRRLPGGCEIWAAAEIDDRVEEPRRGAGRILFDTRSRGQSGGTGRMFDWSLVRHRPELKDGLLAGGLDPDNVRGASMLGAYALDVSSGIEAGPGRKDAAKVAAFMEALRPLSRRELASC